eukprot:CCRYP_013975-RA/>CCRYP_013975-RA protein AED:0.36 eAED:0.44 QI:0/0/0/1/0/0/2/0/151
MTLLDHCCFYLHPLFIIPVVCSKFPDHPFHSITILNEPDLLKDLKDNHLTTDPSDHVPIATGVPPSVKHSQAIDQVLNVCKSTDAKIDSFMDRIYQAVSDAVDAKVAAEGGVNREILWATIQELKDEIFGKIESIQVNNCAHVPDELEHNN